MPILNNFIIPILKTMKINSTKISLLFGLSLLMVMSLVALRTSRFFIPDSPGYVYESYNEGVPVQTSASYVDTYDIQHFSFTRNVLRHKQKYPPRGRKKFNP